MPTMIRPSAPKPEHFHTDEPLVHIGWWGQTGTVYALGDDVAATEPGGFSPIYANWGKQCGHQIREAIEEVRS